MAQSPHLALRQQQSLAMTAQLQQSIKLLQLSSLELAEFIEQEVEKNPILEIEEESEKADADSQEKSTDSGAEKDVVELSAESDLDTRDQLLDTGDDDGWDGDNYAAERSYDTRLGNTDGGDKSYSAGTSDIIEQTAASDISLQDHLLQQLHMEMHDSSRLIVGRYMIGLLDDAGYLHTHLEEVSNNLGCDISLVEDVLLSMQKLDPVGVFARSLQECLELQLRDLDRYDPAMEALVNNLDLLATGEFEKLKQVCAVDSEDLKDMISEIKRLDPKPASHFTVGLSQIVEPDVLVRKTKDGGWHVELNGNVLPRVLINRVYYAQLDKQSNNKQEKKFLNEKMADANWLVKSLDQRARTMLKVATEIVRRQDEFFHYGIRCLRPLTLREIAEEVELHESTVSRVTSNKYMLSPRGMLELKYFFTSSVDAGNSEEGVSSKTVKHYIKELIDAEFADKVLSDEDIATALKDKGINAARRTVAKYRESMNIPSSVKRRRQKKAF